MNSQFQILFILLKKLLIVDQQHDLFMSSLDMDSLFTNIPLEETTEICTSELFKESETVRGLSKTQFKQLLSLATKDSHFIFDGHFTNKSMVWPWVPP